MLTGLYSVHTEYSVCSLAYPVCTLGRKSARFQCANWARLPVYTLDTQCAHWTSNVYTGICVLAGCNICTSSEAPLKLHQERGYSWWSFRLRPMTCQIFKNSNPVLGFGFILIFLPIKNRDFFRNSQNVHISVVRFQKKIFRYSAQIQVSLDLKS